MALEHLSQVKHSANKEETLRLLEGLIKYQQPSKASTWNRQEAQAHAQR